jgi:hypothetical protein
VLGRPVKERMTTPVRAKAAGSERAQLMLLLAVSGPNHPMTITPFGYRQPS